MADVAPVEPEFLDDSPSLKEVKRWEWFMAVVKFNSTQAVDCGLRGKSWRDNVVLISHAEAMEAGSYFALIPRLSPEDRAEWHEYRAIVGDTAAHWYKMPCDEFSQFPLLRIYDSAVRGEGVILAPSG